MERQGFDDGHAGYRDQARAFWTEQVAPRFEEWEEAGRMDRSLFADAAAAGLVATQVAQEHGGRGDPSFRLNQIVNEEALHAGVAGPGLSLGLQNDICLPYLLRYATDEQKQRWLPGVVTGETILAIGLTEPDAGSDLASLETTAEPTDGGYLLNGGKIFIGNGFNADLVIVACKTDPDADHAGISLVVVERGMAGFERVRNLPKLGLRSQDTAELSFTDVEVPAGNLLGEAGEGFRYLKANLPQERLSIAISAVAAARAALEWTLAFTKEREAFDQTVGAFQNTRFVLAEAKTEVEIATHYVDRQVAALDAGELSDPDAAMAKWWCTDLQGRVIDRCLQLHGGRGYLTDFPIARAYADARVTRIYGGTNEIMKEIIGRSLGL